MADKKATLYIQLKDEVTAGIQKIKGTIDTLKASWLGIAAAVATVVAIGAEVLSSFSEQERAVNRLNTALKAQGFYSKTYSDSLLKLASDLQKVTTYSDQSIIETEQLLTTFGLAGKELNSTTKAALDLATGLGIDLRTATLLLGKAWAGETQTLGRYGIKVDETATSTEKFGQVLSIVNQRFGGAAQAETETYAGKIKILSNNFDQLKQAIGAVIAPAASGGASFLTKVIQGWTAILGGDSGIGGGKKMSPEDIFIGPAKPKAPEPKSKQTEDEQLKEQAKKKIEANTLTNYQLEQIEYQHLEKLLKANGQYDMARKLAESQMIKNRKEQIKQLGDSLGTISSLANSKTKELAVIGKAAGFAQAIIHAHQGAALALGTIPPPYGFIVAALVEAAGLAQAASIAGVPVAQGGMVLPTAGGVPLIAGEAGKAEAVIPLDDPSTKDKLADVMGGNTIVIQAGTLVANDYDVRRFAMRIDEELYKLSKRRGRVS